MEVLVGSRCRLRRYRREDAATLAKIAGEFAVARWMTRRFPHPYTLDDANAWVERNSTAVPVDNFAIEVDGALAGGVGIAPQSGEYEGVAEFGYWLGTAYWGRGIGTEAALLLIDHAFKVRGLRRLVAHVFGPNHASARMLEKCGFAREAILRQAFTERDGTIVDGLLFARLARPSPQRATERP